MKTSTVIKALSVIALTVGATVTMAAADSYSETVVTTSAQGLQTATVSFADLDLSTAKAQETLYYRLSSAAHRVCGSTDYRRTGSVRQAAENKNCYNNAMERALSQTARGQVASLSN